MPPVGRPEPGALASGRRPAVKKPGPERREDIDPSSLTSEMEPISEIIEEKRKVDATLARFSAVHDEMAEEERVRRSKRIKLMPWLGKDEDMEEALAPGGAKSMSGSYRPDPEPEPSVPLDQSGPISAVSRLQARRDRQRGKTALGAKIAAGAVAVLILAVSFFAWRAKAAVTGNDQAIQVAALDENSPAILNAAKQNGDANFLLAGTTARPGAGAANTAGTVLVVHVPADGSRAVFVSFPPDLTVSRPACQQWDNQNNSAGASPVAAAQAVKLDSVYATGGPKCLTDTVQQVSGLRINHFVGVDLGGFSTLVDGVSGVSMCVAAPVRDATLGTVVGQAGPVTLTGDQALKFVRAANVPGDRQPAALAKITRQQKFLAALLRRTIGQQNLLMNTSLLNTFLGTFTRSTFGDNLDIGQLTKLATSLQGLSLGHVTFVTLPTGPAPDAAGNETLDVNNTKQLFSAVIDNSPLPGETDSGQNAGTGQNAQTDPHGVKVQVVNGIGDAAPGLAGNTADSLRAQGFSISQVSNSAGAKQTVIRYAAAQQAQARLLASSVPSAALQVDPTQLGAIQLVLGPGFDHKVVAPHAGATNATASEAPPGLSYVNAQDQSCA